MSDQQPGDHLSIRISNDDRERVAQILHNAMAEGRLEVAELEERLDAVYAAKTFADLEPVTRDLPVSAHGPLPAVRPHAAPVPHNRIGGTPGASTSIAIMSGVDRKGDWVVPPSHNVVSIMGGVNIDLTHARFVDKETTINVFALMAGVEIRVPADINVRVDGVGFMGAFEDRTSSTPSTAGPGSPTVRITGFAMMAGVEIKRPKEKRDREQIEGS